MQLVNEQHRVLPVERGQHGLEPLLEVAPVARTRQQRAQVECVDRGPPQETGRLAVGHPLRQPLGERGFAHAGLAHQHRVVLAAPRQNVHHPFEFGAPANHRVELSVFCRLGEVLRVGFQRVFLGGGALRRQFAVYPGHPAFAAAARRFRHTVRQVVQQVEPGHALRLERGAGGAVVLLQQFDEDARAVGLFLSLAAGVQLQHGALHHAVHAEGEVGVGVVKDVEFGELLSQGVAQGVQVGSQRVQGIFGLGVVEQREQQMLLGDVLVPRRLGEVGGALQGGLQVFGKHQAYNSSK